MKLFGLLTVPTGNKPAAGWPVILLNHGYIPPTEYSTDQSYAGIVVPLAAAGYIVFKPDYRGHGNSPGTPYQVYISPGYVSDSLNALASIRKYKDANPDKIGVWGHSMGGMVTLRSMVISQDIKAGVIWGGVVASYPDLLTKWPHPRSEVIATPVAGRRWRTEFIATYGTPEENPDFWNSISPNSFLKDLSGPLQLHASKTDPEVPFVFSQELYQQTLTAGQIAEFYSYPNDDHNLSKDFAIASESFGCVFYSCC